MQEKDARIREALQILQVKKNDFDMSVNEIISDLGVSEKELEKWTLSQDGEAIEEIPEPKKPSEGKETQGDEKK